MRAMSAPEPLKCGTSPHGPGNCQKPIESLRMKAKIAKAAASRTICAGANGFDVRAKRQSARPAAPAGAARAQERRLTEAQMPRAIRTAPAAIVAIGMRGLEIAAEVISASPSPVIGPSRGESQVRERRAAS